MSINERARAWSISCALIIVTLVTFGAMLAPTAAEAASCSNSSAQSSCTVNANVTYTAGTLGLESSPNLYWSMVNSGYDQWSSASASSLSSCAAAANNSTTCSGATAPTLEVLDSTGSGAGWALSEYLSGTALPTGAALRFNGNGSTTLGNSQAAPVSASPFNAATPGTVCDFNSTCTTATAATTCNNHSSLGFTTCPSGAVNMTAGTSATQQVDLYSANQNTGMGAVCFGSGTATAAGCAGTSESAFYNLGLPSGAPRGTTVATINLTVSSGP